jgi:MFS family permease
MTRLVLAHGAAAAIVNVALRSLSVTLHASLDNVQWLVTGYLLSPAAVIPVTGWAERRPRSVSHVTSSPAEENS